MTSRHTAAEDQPKVPRILVVDDMPDNLFLMNGLLEDRYEVIQAPSGQEALKIVMSANPPDMVLLDIMMPDMDGYEVLRRIRQHPPTAIIPVIFLTALASQQDETLGLGLGAIDYLTKPVDPEMIVKRIEDHVIATARARRIEALSEKLSRHLSPEAWQGLFNGPELEAIRFEQKPQTILYAETASMETWTERDRHAFRAEVEWLATRHLGTVDRFVDGPAMVFFEDPSACVRMAMDLHRSASELRLRMGIYTGMCDIGTFRSDFLESCTLIGHETRLAAKVAATAATGSVAVSPETYELIKDDIHSDATGCMVAEEFHDSDLAQVSLTPAPQRGEAANSNFAGLSNFAPLR
ncbi:MAG TPA: response regulator [Ramlibacter sp.]|nr:response regulator [Ramlibacter sp.]